MEREYLRYLRENRNITQKELAEKIGISAIYVRKLEKGTANPGRETMIKYEKFFIVSMKELFPDLFFDINDKKLISKYL